MHQGWDNQKWEEPQAYKQPSWQQPPPTYYEQQPFHDAYQDNGYGGPLCDNQQPPPYAYEPPLQHSFEPPYSQAPYCQTPPYDPNPYPPYQLPYEPYLSPPTFQPNYSQEPPPQYIPPPMYVNFQPQDKFFLPSQPSIGECPYPSIQEQYDPNYVSQAEQEPRDDFKEAMDRLQATIHQMEREEARKAHEALLANKSQLENKGLECVVQQVEKMESVEPPHPYHDEPPSYYEPLLPTDEPSYPLQSPIDNTLGVLLQWQREMQRTTLEFIATLTEVVDNLASLHFNTQSTPMAACGESIEECSIKERLETPVESEECGFVLE
ncbi:uncharacterized protein [Arachis hypogaea]|uniref:uncharacterized protein n=1 Tax=Arachis hypogaea TaxID=3818 RepID=UPI003B21DCD5